MKFYCLLATASLSLFAAPLHPMTLPADGYYSDNPGIIEIMDALSDPFLELLKQMLMGHLEKNSSFIDNFDFLHKLSNELIELLPGDQLEMLIQFLTDYTSCHNEISLENPFVFYSSNNTIYSLLKDYLTRDDLYDLLALLKNHQTKLIPSQQEQEALFPLLILFSDQQLPQNDLLPPLASPRKEVNFPENLEPLLHPSPINNNLSSLLPATHHNTSQKISQCNQCNHKPFTDPSGLARHKKTKHEGRTYQCNQCNHPPFTSPSNLARHMKTKHESITYQCDLCDHKPFADPSGLARHKKTTHGD